MSGKSLIAYLKTSDAKELREILLRQRQYVLEHEGSLENKTENSFSSYVPDSSSITADYSAQPLNHNSTLDSIYNISDYGFINYWYQLTTEELSVAVVSPFIIPLIAIGFFAFLMNSTDGFIKTAGISIGILVPYIISILVELWRRYSRFAGYKIERLDRGLRITSGLLTVNHETVPYGRIQAFRIEQPFLWKIFGLFRLQINLAGTSTKTKVNRQNLIMLPACKFQTAVSFIQIILPQVDFDIPMIPPPKIAFFKGLFWAKAHRVGLSQDIAIVSYGIFRRHWDIVNYKKIQSLRIRKGPINRLLNLNTLHIDTANGPVKFKIKWRSNFDASQVFSFLTDSVVVQHTL